MLRMDTGKRNETRVLLLYFLRVRSQVDEHIYILYIHSRRGVFCVRAPALFFANGRYVQCKHLLLLYAFKVKKTKRWRFDSAKLYITRVCFNFSTCGFVRLVFSCNCVIQSCDSIETSTKITISFCWSIIYSIMLRLNYIPRGWC